jgi:transcriptional regulator with XRE-family HTH domain
MPRPNKTRFRSDESNAARRIAFERDRRNWTNGYLAERLTAHGCALDPSAIYKIQKAAQPRRITVNELAAFAEVFGMSMQDLLIPPDAISERAAALVAQAHDQRNALLAAANALLESLRQLLLLEERPIRPRDLDVLVDLERAGIHVLDLALEIEAEFLREDVPAEPDYLTRED